MKMLVQLTAVIGGVVACALACWWPQFAFGWFVWLWVSYHLYDDLIGFPRPGRKL
jgi:hypothetical protein